MLISRNPVSCFLALLVLASASPSRADDFEATQAFDPQFHSPLKEAGITLLNPTVVNVTLGYWSRGELPWLARVSGMAYEANMWGFQTDFGGEMSRLGPVLHYLAATFRTFNSESDEKFVHTEKSGFGFGPTYGLNWRGVSAQVGVLLGSVSTTRSNSLESVEESGFKVLPQIQVGYTFLWP